VSGSEQPSREELLALIEAQARMIEQLGHVLGGGVRVPLVNGVAS
jgi:hypothetical protein